MDAKKCYKDVTIVLQGCNAVTWFNEDVIRVKHGIIRLQQKRYKSVAWFK